MKLSVVKLRHILPLPFYLCSILSNAFTFQPSGARSRALANASCTFADVWAAENNQAGLGFIKQSAAASYVQNRYRIRELNLVCLLVALHSREGSFGFSASSFGYHAYQEMKFGFSYGRAFAEAFAFGFQISYQMLRIGEYGSSGCPSIALGIQYRLNKKLQTAFHISNPTLASFPGKERVRIPAMARMGLNYLSSDKVHLLTEAEQETGKKIRIKTGIEYFIHPDLVLRAGVHNVPFTNTFGFGFKHKSLQIDAASDIHPVLGLSSHLSMTVSLGKKK
jgi:hypothetical protein